MNLYKVSCIFAGATRRRESMSVYAVAPTPNQAAEAALKLMKKHEYKFDTCVDKIKLIASPKPHNAKRLLAIYEESR